MSIQSAHYNVIGLPGGLFVTGRENPFLVRQDVLRIFLLHKRYMLEVLDFSLSEKAFLCLTLSEVPKKGETSYLTAVVNRHLVKQNDELIIHKE